MLSNYLKTALRSMRRHFAYSFINVLGLAVGLTAAFLILLWVQDELSFDHYPDGVDRVYRVMRTARYGEGQVFTWPAITAKLDEVLDEEYPEIEKAALFTWQEELAFNRGPVKFREKGRHAGVDFFEIFSYPFLAGDRGTVLDDPASVVLSETMARKYFPDDFESTQNAEAGAAKVIGKTLRLENRIDVTVTGIVRDVPPNSSFRFDFILPIEEFAKRNAWVNEWGNNGLRMFVKLTPDADWKAVSDKIAWIIRDRGGEEGSELFLQPYTDIHLRSRYENGVLVGGRIEYVRIFAVVGLFILLIASINFMNLATARSAQRALEIGIRKTFGGSRRSLATQFLGESLLTTLFALVLAVGAVFLLLPGFNTLTGKSISLGLTDGRLWLEFLGLTVLTGLFAGAYPALYLSGTSIINVLRRGILTTSRGSGLRKGLVVFQFAISIVLIVATVTVYNQLEFIRSKNLGVDRENVIFTRLEGRAQKQYDSFRSELLKNPGIVAVTSGSTSPLGVGTSTGGPRWDGKPEDDRTLFYIITAGYDYPETMRMKLLTGRTFSRDFTTDTNNVVVNESAVKAMGMEDPVGQNLAMWGREGKIIGVVKDFHMASLYDKIEPLIIRLEPEDARLVFIRTAPGETESALATFQKTLEMFNPEYPFEYKFLDTTFEETYRSEAIIGKLATYFALLAIFVACLGLFGMASFTTVRRSKEIGIRKVLGASVPNVVVLLSRDFIVLVAVAFVLGAPIAFYLMDGWLSDFAFHTNLGAGVFILTAVAVAMIAFGTVAYQAIKAALSNPTESILSE